MKLLGKLSVDVNSNPGFIPKNPFWHYSELLYTYSLPLASHCLLLTVTILSTVYICSAAKIADRHTKAHCLPQD